MRIKHIFFLLMGLLFLEGCYKDDLEDCPIMLHVYFESIMEKEGYEYENVTDQLDLYLYDQGGTLAQKFSYSRNDLEAVQFTPVLPIENFGDYTLVALVNAKQTYTVDSNNRDAFKVSLKKDDKDTVRTKPYNLHHAYKSLQLPYTGIINQYDTLALYKNTNQINVDIFFEDSSMPGMIDNLHVYLGGNNGSSNYRNICLSNDYRIYTPLNKQKVSEHLKLQFTTMRLWAESDLTLYIENSNEELKTLRSEMNIAKELAKTAGYDTAEKWEKEDIYNIKIILKNDYTIIGLVINDWTIKEVGEEI